MLLGAVGLPAAVLAPFVSPYIDGKLLVTLTPAVVLLALVSGLLAARSGGRLARTRWPGGVAVIGGGAAAYWRRTCSPTGRRKLAPLDRMEAMEDAAAQRSPATVCGCSTSGRSSASTSCARSGSTRRPRLEPPRVGGAPAGGSARSAAGSISTSSSCATCSASRGIVMRRSPDASRPPGELPADLPQRLLRALAARPGRHGSSSTCPCRDASAHAPRRRCQRGRPRLGPRCCGRAIASSPRGRPASSP